MRFFRVVVLGALMSGLVDCSAGPVEVEIDAGVGELDAGVIVIDAGVIETDSGVVVIDAGGVVIDAGQLDAGAVDAGAVDAGFIDAGTTPDAGMTIDAGDTCGDGIKNGTETGIDCGGTCTNCPTVLDPTQATDFADATAFLFTGANPAQVGVQPGSISPKRQAVLRGKVLDITGAPLAGVTVSVHGEPALGSTTTRASGTYDLVVNGGSWVALDFVRPGVLPAQRRVLTPMRDLVALEDVVLLALDTQVTTLSMPVATTQTHLASPVTDADGTRRASLVFEPGTQASMIIGGVSQPLTSLHVRATEYTVGPKGPNAMPGSLPDHSAYTYAVELSVDEALDAGATEVRFTQPVTVHVKNFLGFPVGTPVPTGYYDRVRAVWVPAENGKVLGVVSVTSGLADLDVDGTGTAASATALAALAITDAERSQLAAEFPVGTSFWRSRVTHFTPFDLNWPWGEPPNAAPPPVIPPKPPLPPEPCEKAGSVLRCEERSLGESVAITGTPYALSYTSARTARQLSFTIPVSEATLPPGLRRIEVEVQLLGRMTRVTLPPTANQTYTFTWDGLDAWGRPVFGEQVATGRVLNVFKTVFTLPPGVVNSFGLQTRTPPTTQFILNTERREASLAREFSHTFPEARLGASAGLGGWSLSAHHAFDRGTLALGDGKTVPSRGALGNVMTTVAGTGTPGFSGDGNPGVLAQLRQPQQMAIGPDGSVFFTTEATTAPRVRKLSPTGIITTFAGNGTNVYPTDGVLATQTGLRGLRNLAVGPDGSLYVTRCAPSVGPECQVARIGADGILRRIAGETFAGPGEQGDEGPALNAYIFGVSGIAVAADSSYYIATESHVRHVTTDGIIHAFACDGSNTFSGDDGPAVLAGCRFPFGVALGRDGAVFINESGRIRRVGGDGIITTVAGTGAFNNGTVTVDGPATTVPVSPSGIVTDGAGDVIVMEGGPRQFRMLRDGMLLSIAGIRDTVAFNGDNRHPLDSAVSPAGLAWHPDGSLYVADAFNHRIRRIASPYDRDTAADVSVPSGDGREVYVFSARGRHLRTIDGLSGATTQQFTYDAAGRLATAAALGRVTTIERDTAGNPTAIVAPNGQRTALTLDADGFLATITAPGGAVTRFTTLPTGELSTMTAPGGGLYRFTYDDDGAVTRDEDPAGGSSTFDGGTSLTGARTTQWTSALGRTSSYVMQQTPLGAHSRTATSSTGAVTQSLISGAGVTTVTHPTGIVETRREAPHPRFAQLAPYTAQTTLRTPSGLTFTANTLKTATLANATDPFSLTQQIETTTINGRVFTATYDAATRTVSHVTPGGTHASLTTDSRGLITEERLAAGIDALTYGYDAQGRLTTVTQGSATRTYGYDALDHRASFTDAMGRQTQYAYDAAGRLTSSTLPGSGVFSFGYDADSNRTSATLPSGARNTQAYSPVGLPTVFTPAGGAAQTKTYDADRNLTGIAYPTGRAVTWAYDAVGRVDSVTAPEATFTYAYGGTSDVPVSITRTPTIGAAQSLTTTFDGHLVTRTSFGGAAVGQFDYRYDANLFLVGLRIDNGPETLIVRDGDGRITSWGPFAMVRGGPSGAPSLITGAGLSLAHTYDAAGRSTRKTVTVADAGVFDATTIFDATSMVTGHVETSALSTRVIAYVHDVDRQLTAVQVNGATVERYAYDVDGNRTSRTIGAGPAETVTLDGEKRVTAQGALAFAYNSDGQLVQRGSDTFQYSARGELLRATVLGVTVTYAYDGQLRRVARTEGAQTRTYFYGDLEEPFRITATKGPEGLTVFTYDDLGNLFSFVRAGITHHVATDALGSPRVVTTATGVIVKTLDYDAFGNVTDSTPAFELPIGFAGGQSDERTKLVRFGVRDYEPVVGRFTSRDPMLFDSERPNLYLYVRNDPVSARDPHGFASITASLYKGLGGGFTAAANTTGVSFCVEAGYGAGVNVSADKDWSPNAELERPGVSLGAEIKARRGPISIAAKGEWSRECGGKAGAELTVGPISVNDEGELFDKGVKDGRKSLKTGYALQAKAFARYCVRALF